MVSDGTCIAIGSMEIGNIAFPMKLPKERQKQRILSLDGGGIRCAISVEILLALERSIAKQTGNPQARLSDSFDLVAGTSAGAILGAAISLGISMTELREFVILNARNLFKPSNWLDKARSVYDKTALELHLQELYGENTELGSKKLKTLLLLILSNWSTDSPWLISNNPEAKFNKPELDDCNLRLSLWELVRASAAAPYYYEPETIRLGKHQQYEHVFVDGALTGFLNPAFKAFQYVTNSAYGLNWNATENNLTIISIGTGDTREKKTTKTAKDINRFSSIRDVPDTIMYASVREQDLLCRSFGRCLTGEMIDLEVSDMKSELFAVEPRLFSYHRVNPFLSQEGLTNIGCSHIDADNIKAIDAIESLQSFLEIGRAMTPIINNMVRVEWDQEYN